MSSSITYSVNKKATKLKKFVLCEISEVVTDTILFVPVKVLVTAFNTHLSKQNPLLRPKQLLSHR